MAEKTVIDAMWDDSPIDVSTEVNFIWSIANKLRGPYQSDKYKDVIIPMTIIRRFECALEPTKKKVVDQYKANPNFPAKAMYRISGFQFYNTRDSLRMFRKSSCLRRRAWISTSRSTRWIRTTVCFPW